jgi:hypothetical protein
VPLAQTVTIEAPPVLVPLDRDSPLREWMADPIGRRLLERELADPSRARVSKEQMERMGDFPLSPPPPVFRAWRPVTDRLRKTPHPGRCRGLNHHREIIRETGGKLTVIQRWYSNRCSNLCR